MKFARIALFVFSAGVLSAAGTESLTLRLTRVFDAAWDRGDLAALYAMFDPDCVYKTPFRTEIGRDAVRDHVFPNVPKFRDSVSTEDSSHIEGDMAYATGTTTFNEYDAKGALKTKWTSKYLYLFTRRPGEDWKIRFHVVHEATPPR
ncbi:MAG TPA: nuclear transport factor 2 family protein [Opitutaceae bacterium]|nr:nuclear transport factor 2 family protein [Opitutaceae bacterium]